MRKLVRSSLFAIAVLSLLTVMPAMATVVTFDDLTTPNTWLSTPSAWNDFGPSYAGLNWAGWEVMNRPAYQAIYGGDTTPVPSDPNFAYPGNDAASLTVSSADPFNFLGAQFAFWPGAKGAASSVTITGYLGASLIGTVSMSSLSGWAPSGGIAGVDRLEFSTNLGSGASPGYFRMDNLSYESSVPEPLTAGLVGIALIGLSLLNRRRKTATS